MRSPVYFTRQPSGPVRINWDHPSARGLIDFCIARPFGLYSVTTGQHSVSLGTTAPGFLVGRGGVARHTQQTSSTQYEDISLASRWSLAANAADGGFTLYGLCQVGSSPGSTTPAAFGTVRHIIGFMSDTSTARGVSLTLDSSEQLIAAATVNTFRTSGAIVVPYGETFGAFAIADPAAGLYVDAGPYGTSTASATWTAGATAANSPAWRHGLDASSTSPGNKAVYAGIVWARLLDANERASIFANPWALLEPKPIWVPVTAAAGTFQAAWAARAQRTIGAGVI